VLAVAQVLDGAGVVVQARPVVQGTADLVRGAAGATAGLLAGLLAGHESFAVLAECAALLVVLLAVATLLRPRASLVP
jgi:hypothetical protein